MSQQVFHDFSGSLPSSLPFSDIIGLDEQQQLFEDQQINSFLNSNMGDVQDTFYNEFAEDESPYAPKDMKVYFPKVPLAPHVSKTLLSNEEYAGPYEFEAVILPTYKSKNPWVYSPDLNKVFMGMEQHFPVDFKIKNRPPFNLYIRATPQYSVQNFSLEPVIRCIQHQYPSDPTNKDVPDHVKYHVIRCTNQKTDYLGSVNDNVKLSLAIPFEQPQVGNESVREMFYFVCMTSCSNPGMNRRSLEVIFTLEDETGKILGRKCLNARICACPKRDREKEESELKKDKSGAPRGKKRKAEPSANNSGKVAMECDSREFPLNLKVIGKSLLLKILNYAEDATALEAYRTPNQAVTDQHKKNIAEIQAIKHQLN